MLQLREGGPQGYHFRALGVYPEPLARLFRNARKGAASGITSGLADAARTNGRLARPADREGHRGIRLLVVGTRDQRNRDRADGAPAEPACQSQREQQVGAAEVALLLE